MSEQDYPAVLSDRQQLLFVALFAVVVGVAFAPYVFGAAVGSTDIVAVVEIDGPIDGALADDVEAELSEIRQNDSVKAVVLKMDTGGGAPAASERLYTSVQRTGEQMPVIASVQGISASGGYYAMLPADEIYVLPTSITGSVGLAANAPKPSEPVRGPSGPDKRGGNKIERWALQQTIADTFVTTVMEERGDEIELSREEVAHADIYLGTEAYHNGFADEIGSLDDATLAAAQRADLDNYEVAYRETGEDDLPILIRTDEQLYAVYSSDPGFGDVQPMTYALVYEGNVPHISTIERFSQVDIESAVADDANRTAASGADDGNPASETTEESSAESDDESETIIADPIIGGGSR